jgi:glycosyltransferase involved in cell wall biosynthesis
MKIVYLINYDLNQNSGVVQKIKQQSEFWKKFGHEVYFLSYKNLTLYDSQYNVIKKIDKLLNIKLGRIGTAINMLNNIIYIKELLKEMDFDLIYMRYQLYMPFWAKILKKYKVIMEINSDDKKEYQLQSKITAYYNIFTRGLILKHIDGFVSVSYELKEKFLYLNKPIEVIANGINTNEYELMFPKNKKPILVFIGTPNQPWHGLDKIEKMAQYFSHYQFYIIGIKKENRKNVRYFGYLSKEESTNIIKNCDVGIGTLSLYKKGLYEASPLKTRQYLACGLPILYAYKDTDLDDDVEFALRLKNCEDNIDYKKIEAFVDRVFQNYDLRKKARGFAINVLDFDKKERKRLKFFKRVLDEK